MAGKLGCGGGPLLLFFPLGGVQAQMLQEQKGDQRHQRMPMQTAPGAALEVIKPEFLFQLLMPCSQTHRALIAGASCLSEVSGGRLER